MAKKEDKRAYFKVDIGYLSNPKVAELMDEYPRAILLHLQCIAYSAQHLTDGVVPMRIAMRIACAEQCDLDACLNAGLLRKVNGTHLEVHDYLLHQRSAESVKGMSEAGKRAALARWDADGNAEGSAVGNADRMRNPMPREKEREKEKTLSASAAAEQDGEFAAFWDAYPKKRDKGHAVKAYRAARKKTSDVEILTGLTRVLPEWSDRDPQFIPLASTWLNGERWEDEPESNVRQLRVDDQGRTVLPPLPGTSPWGPA